MHTGVCAHLGVCVPVDDPQLEEERLAALARKEFFTSALAELRLAQSKVTRTVVEAQQRWVGRRGQSRGLAEYVQPTKAHGIRVGVHEANGGAWNQGWGSCGQRWCLE